MGIHAPFPSCLHLELPPKPWHQPIRPRVCTLLKSLEQPGISSLCTSRTCSWIQKFPVDSRTGQSVRTVSVDSVWTGYSTCFLGRGSHSNNACSPRWEKEPLLHSRQRVRSCRTGTAQPLQMSVSH